MQEDSIEALHQNRNPLVQEAGLSSLARVFRDPPSKIIEEVTSWCVNNAKCLYCNYCYFFRPLWYDTLEFTGLEIIKRCKWLQWRTNLAGKVPKNETTFPLCRAMDSLWNRKVVSLLSSVMTVVLLPISSTSSIACWLHDPTVSMATGNKMWVFSSLWYFTVLLSAACLAAAPCSAAVGSDGTRRKCQDYYYYY